MATMVNVIVVFFNEEKFIGNCLQSILAQSYTDFELVLVDDDSTDGSAGIIKSLADGRIRYLKNEKRLGIARSRNVGLGQAKGKFIFFTDADCVVDKNWLKMGLKYLLKGYSAVEGRTIYTLRNPSLRHKVIENTEGGLWFTCNMAYAAEAIRGVGGFNPIYGSHGEDKDLALRIRRQKKIIFSKYMLVFHQAKEWSFRKIIQTHKHHARAAVYFYKYFSGDFNFERLGIVVSWRHLAVLLFPPLLIYKAFRDRIRGLGEIKFLFIFYLAYLVERYYIWKTALEERLFLI